MTAIEHRDYSLLCDKPGRPRCPARFPGTTGVSRAEVRKLAAKDGWTHVRSNWGRKFDEDFCPAHKPGEDADTAGED